MYQVEDVAMRDGKLRARDGTELAAPAPFKSDAEPPPTRPPSDRLVRRGN
jgi:hypothetical protein